MDNIRNKSTLTPTDLFQEGKEKISEVYNTAKEKTEELTSQARETASNLYQEGKDKVSDLEDAVCDYREELVQTVKDKPVASILVAAGIGYLLAKIFKK